MSLKLTTSLSQRLVLTPQLRQRIEMLQMTTLELSDLIQQQLLENPVLEEVPSQDEVQELAEKVLDHLANSDSEAGFEPVAGENNELELGGPSSNGSGDADVLAALPPGEGEGGEIATGAEHGDESIGEEVAGDETAPEAFEEIDLERGFAT